MSLSWIARSIAIAWGVIPFALGAGVCLAESSAFTPSAAETFTGKQALEDAFLRLQLDLRKSRDQLELLGIGRYDLVTYWQWSAPDDSAPPSIEFHLDSGARVVIDTQSGLLLAYVRYGAYWITPGTPESSVPEKPRAKADAIAEDKAATVAIEWLKKFAPEATWNMAPPVYKDHFDAVPEDLFGAWWEFSIERTHSGYPVRGHDAEIALNAETGQLMRFLLPNFVPPAGLEIYFPPENTRIKAEDYLVRGQNTLDGLLVFKPSVPEQQVDETGGKFAVRGALGSRAQRREAKRLTKQAKKEGTEEGGQVINPIPPTLVSEAPTLAIWPVHECWKQETWQPIDPTKPLQPRCMLVYEFATQTPTAMTLPVLITASGNEVVR